MLRAELDEKQEKWNNAIFDYKQLINMRPEYGMNYYKIALIKHNNLNDLLGACEMFKAAADRGVEDAKEMVKDFPNTYLFEKEAELLDMFLDLIKDADVISGWNSEGFDIPYTTNRVTKVLSKEDTRRFCLFDQFHLVQFDLRYAAGQRCPRARTAGRGCEEFPRLCRASCQHEGSQWRARNR